MKKILIVLTIAGLLLLSLAGCASGFTGKSDGDYYAEAEVAEEPAYENGAPQVATEEAASAPAEKPGLNFDGSILEPDANRKIIYYGSFEIRTKDFDADYESVVATLKELGGYIEESSIYGEEPEDWQDSGRYATLSLRVPSKNFDVFTGRLGNIGETLSSSVSGQDISLEYFDTETKLKSLRTRETRLLALLEKAATLEDIVELEKALADVSYEIQMLETNLRNYDSLIDYSTVTVSLQEVYQVGDIKPSDESIGSRISNAFYSVLNALADFGEFLLVFIIGGLPVFIILAAIAVLVIVLVKRSKKKKMARHQNNSQNQQ
jgi:flagellar basal body-associated protein FliL